MLGERREPGERCFACRGPTLEPERKVSLWSLEYRLDQTIDAATWSCLDDAERARAERFHRHEDRLRFAATRAALRELLADRLHCPAGAVDIQIGPHGKPRLPGAAPLAFNVAHSAERGLVAIADGAVEAVGVDVERVDSKMEWREPAQQVMHPLELAALDGLPRARALRRFFELWALKEAFLKALGVGFEGEARRWAFTPATEWRQGARETHLIESPVGAVWVASVEVAPAYTGAIAVVAGRNEQARATPEAR